jgi:hypothetical protein
MIKGCLVNWAHTARTQAAMMQTAISLMMSCSIKRQLTETICGLERKLDVPEDSWMKESSRSPNGQGFQDYEAVNRLAGR